MYVVPEELRNGNAVSRADTLKALEASPLLVTLHRKKALRRRALRAAWSALPEGTDFVRLASLLSLGAWKAVEWDDESESLRARRAALESWILEHRAEFAAIKRHYAASLKLTGWELVCHDCDAVLWRRFGGTWPPEAEARKRCKTAGCDERAEKKGRGVRRIFAIPRGPARAAVVAFLQAAQRDYPALSLFYDLDEHPPTVRLDGAKAPRALPDSESPGVRSAKGQALRGIKDLIGPEVPDALRHLLVFAVGVGDLGRVARGSRVGRTTDEAFIEDFEKRYSTP